jgi:hypothetical protein
MSCLTQRRSRVGCTPTWRTAARSGRCILGASDATCDPDDPGGQEVDCMAVAKTTGLTVVRGSTLRS